MELDFEDCFGLTKQICENVPVFKLTLLHPEWPKLYGVLAILSAKGLPMIFCFIPDNARVAVQYLKQYISPLFITLLGVRLYSILFLIQRVIKNFGLQVTYFCIVN